MHAHLRDALAHEQKLEILTARREPAQNLLRTQNAEQRADHEAALFERNELDSQLAKIRLVAGNDLQITRLAEDRGPPRRGGARAGRPARDREDPPASFSTTAPSIGNNGCASPRNSASKNPTARRPGSSRCRAPTNPPRSMRPSGCRASIRRWSTTPATRCARSTTKIKELEGRESRLRRELDDLDHKGSAAPSPLLDALKSRGQKADALGRVIEVKAEAEPWWPLLESLLGIKRGAVLATDFKAAWDQARRLGHVEEPLVHPDELGALPKKPKPGTVAALFETDHELARSYLHHLYGDLIAVESAGQLDAHPRAFSKDGWLKDPPHRQHFQPSKEFTIGEEGLRRLRTLRQDELAEVQRGTGPPATAPARIGGRSSTAASNGRSTRATRRPAARGSATCRGCARNSPSSTRRFGCSPRRSARRWWKKLRVMEKTFHGVHRTHRPARNQPGEIRAGRSAAWTGWPGSRKKSARP